MSERIVLIISLLFLCNARIMIAQQQSGTGSANDFFGNRSQIPLILQKSYLEVNPGYINYPFSSKQLTSGYSLKSVDIYHPAVRLAIGYDFNKYVSTQISYMRPVLWVKYNYFGRYDSPAKVRTRSVWMSIGGLTIKPKIPVGSHFSLFGEVGLGIVTRHGFEDTSGFFVIKSAKYNTFLFGGGVIYCPDKRWGVQLISNYSPESKKNNQPYTSFIGCGIKINMSPFSETVLIKTSAKRRIHPKQWVQTGITSNIAGYGLNNTFSDFSLFWGGRSELKNGITLGYIRNIFHAPKVFAFDIGTNISCWQTMKYDEYFYTVSVYPLIRFNFLHTKPFDAFFYYALAGPTFISKVMLDGNDTGRNFTFYDAMGVGTFIGKKRQYNLELKIGHFSNGNIFEENVGIKIPLSINLGYAF